MFDYYQFDSIFEAMKSELNVFDVNTAEKATCDLISKYRDKPDSIFLETLLDATFETARTEHINNDNPFLLTALTQHERDLIQDSFERRLWDVINLSELEYPERDKELIAAYFFPEYAADYDESSS